MGRRRLQQKGDLRIINGWWRGRWREDQIEADGSVKYGWAKFRDVGPAVGKGRLTKPQAEREFWERYLSRLDLNMRTPQSILTVAEFVERRFLPEYVAMLKKGGRTHYDSALRYVLDGIPESRVSRKGLKMVRDASGKLAWPEMDGRRVAAIGDLRMRDVGHEDVQRLVSEATNRGLSVQTAKHIKNCVSAIFEFADEVRWFNGKNPAKHVRLPEMQRKAVHVPTMEQFNAIIGQLKPGPRAMALCAALTSMNIAEVCGLRWKRVNLTGAVVLCDGEAIPPFHALVREQWYLRQWGSVKVSGRRRAVPLPTILAQALEEVKIAAKRANLDDAVFGNENGCPLDQTAIMTRHIRPAAQAAGIGKIGWHDLRRAFATWSDQMGLSMGERQALMGHSRAAMTMNYTHTPTDAAIAALERMSEKVKGAVN